VPCDCIHATQILCLYEELLVGRYLVMVTLSFEAMVRLRFRLLCGASGYTPIVLQSTEAYCTNPALVPPPFHLQWRSTSDDVRGLY
jgi:hypothetical protein